MTTRPASRRKTVTARLVALLLPIVAVVFVPTAAHAATYCYTVIAAQPSGWIYSWGAVDSCTQPIQAELHLRENISWSPDREVSADYRYNVTSAFMEVGASCFPTPGQWHEYFVETRVRVNNKYEQKVRSAPWIIQYYCS
jgi:hypothetical protein